MKVRFGKLAVQCCYSWPGFASTIGMSEITVPGRRGAVLLCDKRFVCQLGGSPRLLALRSSTDLSVKWQADGPLGTHDAATLLGSSLGLQRELIAGLLVSGRSSGRDGNHGLVCPTRSLSPLC